MVHHAGRAQALVVLGALCLALSGCLGSGSGGPASQAGATIGGSIRTADCEGWHSAGPGVRQNTIREIRGFAGGPVGESPRDGATLPDKKAYELFEGQCRPDYAKRFKLYKLYTRAAAFQKRVQ